jgi:hypothetical protein
MKVLVEVNDHSPAGFDARGQAVHQLRRGVRAREEENVVPVQIAGRERGGDCDAEAALGEGAGRQREARAKGGFARPEEGDRPGSRKLDA